MKRFHKYSAMALAALLALMASAEARTIRISKAYGPYTEPPFGERVDVDNDVWHTNTLMAITHPNLIYNVPGDTPGDVLEIIFDDSATYSVLADMTALEPNYFSQKTIRWELGNSGSQYAFPDILMRAGDGQTPTIDYSGLPNNPQVGGRNAFQIFHVHPADRRMTFQGIRFINRDLNEDPHPSSAVFRQGGNGTIILKDCVFETVSPVLWINRWDASESPVFVNDVPEVEHCAFTMLKGNRDRGVYPIINHQGDGQLDIKDSTFVLKTETPDPTTSATVVVLISEVAPDGERPNATYSITDSIIYQVPTVLEMVSGFDGSKLTYNYNIDFPAAGGKVAGTGNQTVDPLLTSFFPNYLIDFDNSPAVGNGSTGGVIGYAKGAGPVEPTAAKNFTIYE